MPAWDEWARGELEALRVASLWRAPRDLDAAGPEGKLGPEGTPVVSFASNDYLGLSQHPEVVAAAHAALERWGTGAGSARLIVGSRPVHTELEHELAKWKGAERAVLLPTGFMANLAVVSTLGGPDVEVLSDELNHASIIDGCRLARATVRVYRHNDVDHLGELLRSSTARRRLVVTETVFSMDGDVAPIEEIRALCDAHDALLVVDEAHAVLGPTLVASPGMLQVGTLSKTLGSLGGFVTGPAQLVELLVNRARPYIFTTASAPADAAAALAAVRVLASADGAERISRLRANVDALRPGHPSPIVPVVLGDAARALAASAALLEQGMLVPAVRPPTVPTGTARLRVTLSAAHTPDQVDALSRRARAVVTPVRPACLVLVAGTGTGVGKTWFTAATAGALRRQGVAVAARKPVQSYDPAEPRTDADVLGEATDERADAVCPPGHWFEVPMAPPMAADHLGRRAPVLAELVDAVGWPEGIAVGFVETVGGPRSPVTNDADSAAMAAAFAPDVTVLVADAALGAVNAVRVSAAALAGSVVIALNRYDPAEELHRRNAAWLATRDGFTVVTSSDDLASLILTRTPGVAEIHRSRSRETP